MATERHGFSVGIEQTDGAFFLSLHARGKLTHEDYQSMVPILESAIAGVEKPKIDVFLDATELTGWELHAAWDDFKLGLKHGLQFNRVAIVGNKRWQYLAARLGSWFIGGEARFFEEESPAMAWLHEAE